MKTVDEKIKDETKRYLSYVIVDEQMKSKYSVNPLSFWNDLGRSYPSLQQLASIFLGMSAASVPLESIFSTTDLISYSQRLSLCPSKINKISFLHDNLDCVTDLCRL